MEIFLALLFGFACGSVPFGLILTQAAGLGDVRKIGSGSIGATNVLRTGNKGLAAATVLLDAAKGAVPVLVAPLMFPSATSALGGPAELAAVGAVAGHCFTPWLKFRGGKGFATAAGVLGALNWPLMLLCAGIWATTLAISRISSVSSMTTVVAAPIMAAVFGHDGLVAALIAIALIVLVQHRANIGRLMRGEEPKVGSSK
ncbi:glycerol-3-phosphate 1-O-acyltransferase PlsY [Erythrobacter sp. THAF29]|uniref:glycerol-3-phosphate 1-O-acyltransferase PlsY n=1 Tax=Erythrobacter sp. THAF29 TaxID=2587851 RepID=UPI0012680785|nr:glycerol-3-phosphate 1-O-acyltransferase PlsY [Erythrobacter sp. THAF29]QFT77625.1 putative glycerol-3-phosphate acyltransferase [Erythrobacter sp. THAF29]